MVVEPYALTGRPKVPCRVCGRVSIGPDGEHGPRYRWAKGWCWTCVGYCASHAGKNAYRGPIPSRADIDSYLSSQLANLASRQMRGRAVTRCEVVCGTGNQCGGYGEREFRDRRVCKNHYTKLRNGKSPELLGHEAPRMIVVAAFTKEHFIEQMRSVVPKEWIDAIMK